MKSFLILSICLFAISNAALDKEFVTKIKGKIQEIGKKCVEETKASEADIVALMKHVIPESHEGKCMIFCFNRNFNIQQEDGSLNPKDKAGEFLAPVKEQDEEIYNKAMKILDTCYDSAIIDADPCVTGTNLAICAKKEAEVEGLDPTILQ